MIGHTLVGPDQHNTDGNAGMPGGGRKLEMDENLSDSENESGLVRDSLQRAIAVSSPIVHRAKSVPFLGVDAHLIPAHHAR